MRSALGFDRRRVEQKFRASIGEGYSNADGKSRVKGQYEEEK